MDTQPRVRPYRRSDRDGVADVCVRTADNGGDSRHLYPDPTLMPTLFAHPYCHLDPELAFVLDDGHGRVGGYIVGTADTERFATQFRDRWLPLVAGRFPEPRDTPATPTEEMVSLLHHPERMVLPALRDYPAHLHVDLLPAWQRRGHGRALMRTLLGALHRRGVPAVHLGMVTANTAARAFYDRLGFRVLPVPDPGVLTYLGRSTELTD